MQEFQKLQIEFAAHIRHPEKNIRPNDVEKRRMKIYNDLFYNNIQGFVEGAFPVCRKLFSDSAWHSMVRDFVHRHLSSTPYFLEISQEFLDYLQNERQAGPDDPPFLLELAHYEWVELALDIAEEELPERLSEHLEINTEQLLTCRPLVSPLAWPLMYQYPVHRIGPDFQPTAPDLEPTCLIVYRNRADLVKFLETNTITNRLMEILSETACTGEQALLQVAQEMGHPNPQAVLDGGLQTLQKLSKLDIIVGIEN